MLNVIFIYKTLRVTKQTDARRVYARTYIFLFFFPAFAINQYVRKGITFRLFFQPRISPATRTDGRLHVVGKNRLPGNTAEIHPPRLRLLPNRVVVISRISSLALLQQLPINACERTRWIYILLTRTRVYRTSRMAQSRRHVMF